MVFFPITLLPYIPFPPRFPPPLPFCLLLFLFLTQSFFFLDLFYFFNIYFTYFIFLFLYFLSYYSLLPPFSRVFVFYPPLPLLSSLQNHIPFCAVSPSNIGIHDRHHYSMHIPQHTHSTLYTSKHTSKPTSKHTFNNRTMHTHPSFIPSLYTSWHQNARPSILTRYFCFCSVPILFLSFSSVLFPTGMEQGCTGLGAFLLHSWHVVRDVVRWARTLQTSFVKDPFL